MGKSFSIDIEHVTRIEGHGGIRIEVREGRVEELRLEIVEANRFFENLVKGMLPHDIPQTVSRICGICCVGHQLAAMKAAEAALGLRVSDRTILLRKLLNESQLLQSHILHLFFLALPDYAGAKSILPLARSKPELVKRALAFKKLANDITAVFGGRALHPMAATLGGWRKLPDPEEVARVHARLAAALSELEALTAVVRDFEVPAYERPTEYVSLTHPEEYALYDGEILSSDTGTAVPAAAYREVTNERTVSYSTAKWASWHRESYLVGALARVNNNFSRLHARARETAAALGLAVPCHNPYMGNAAQMVEVVHCAHNSLAMLESVLARGLAAEETGYRPGPGRGIGAVEVPRGTLFHEYAFGEDGRCIEASIVIPTSQNINNIEQDMRAFVPAMLGKMSREELALHMEMLLRAYDPCISCAVHMLEKEQVSQGIRCQPPVPSI